MNCNICHYSNDQENAYCENCGIKLLPSVAGEVWRARDIVSFFSDALYIKFNLLKSLFLTSIICAIGYIAWVYVLNLPTKYSFFLLTALLWVLFVYYHQSRKILKSLSLQDRNKHVIAHGPATLIGPAASIGGWLYLMGDALIFTPESYFINSPVVIIPFTRLRSKSTELGFTLADDKFQIITTEGQEYAFSVPRRGKWLQLIDQALFNLINAD
jgi:hypothetical protein